MPTLSTPISKRTVSHRCIARCSCLAWSTTLIIATRVDTSYSSGLRSLVFGLRSLVFGLRSSVFGLWSLVFGLRSSVFGLWSLVFGLWSSVFGLRSSVFGLRSLVFGLWHSVFGVFNTVCKIKWQRMVRVQFARGECNSRTQQYKLKHRKHNRINRPKKMLSPEANAAQGPNRTK